VPVTGQSCAIVGEIGPRTAENQGLNNTLGFVVTEQGVVLVGSGATLESAGWVEEAVASVTEQPILMLVNIGVQDHHWMGNAWFAEQGIPIMALKRTVENQKRQVSAHQTRMAQQVGKEAAKTLPVYAPEPIDADRHAFKVGGVAFELIWPGDGHFAGDAVLWLPESRTLFSGDFIFHDRLLGVQPTSPVVRWRDSFKVLAGMGPKQIIPGHGYPGDLAKSQRETGDYLDLLVGQVGQALEDWVDIEEVVEELADAPAFSELEFFGDWHRRNIHQTYLQMESQ
jgi:glyoxylase-like metal-dependent hydrolase (beta-lactamase superfamily II)